MEHGEVFAKITQMREAAANIRRSASQIDSCLQSIDREVRALGSDRFMSIGAEAFRAEYHRLTPRLHEAFDLLHRFQDKLQTSADDIEMATRADLSGGAG